MPTTRSSARKKSSLASARCVSVHNKTNNKNVDEKKDSEKAGDQKPAILIVDNVQKNNGTLPGIILKALIEAMRKNVPSIAREDLLKDLRWMKKGGLMIHFKSHEVYKKMTDIGFDRWLVQHFGESIYIHEPKSFTKPRKSKVDKWANENNDKYAGALAMRGVPVTYLIEHMMKILFDDNPNLKGTIEMIRLTKWDTESKSRKPLKTIKLLVEKQSDIDWLLQNGLTLGFEVKCIIMC